MRSLVSNSNYAKKDRNGPPSANQVNSRDEPRHGHAVCTLRVQTAWPCLGLSLEVTWLALGGTFILFGINGVRNKQSHLVGPPFPEFKARFSATAGWHFSRDLTRHLLIGRYGQSHVSVKDG